MTELSTMKRSELATRPKIGKIATDRSTAGMRALGRLVIDLALDPSKIPQTQPEIRALLLANGVTIPPEVTRIDMVAQTKNHVVLTIPPTDVIEQTLYELAADEAAGRDTQCPLPMPKWPAASSTARSTNSTRCVSRTIRWDSADSRILPGRRGETGKGQAFPQFFPHRLRCEGKDVDDPRR